MLDILSGCYWSDGAQAGHILLLLGRGNLQFAAAVPLTNAAGKPVVNVSLTREQASGSGSEILDAICTHQHAVDYDDDGDLDLVVGSFGSKFFLHENVGDPQKPTFQEKPVELPIRSPDHHGAPHVVDWNGDGKLDLLTGGASGAVYVSVNEGSSRQPKWGAFRLLLPGSSHGNQRLLGAQEIKPGPSTRIWAYDWNGDGLLDLIVGDCATITRPVKGLSDEDFTKKIAEYDMQLSELQKSLAAVHQRIDKARQDAKPIDERLQRELTAAQQAYQKAYQQLEETSRRWMTVEKTGHVWVYLRKR